MIKMTRMEMIRIIIMTMTSYAPFRSNQMGGSALGAECIDGKVFDEKNIEIMGKAPMSKIFSTIARL